MDIADDIINIFFVSFVLCFIKFLLICVIKNRSLKILMGELCVFSLTTLSKCLLRFYSKNGGD